jgi:hypothetical protein
MLERRAELPHDRQRIRAIHALDVVALERLHEGFRQSVGLRAADRRGQRLLADLASKGAGVTRDVGRTVVGEPVNRLRRRPSGEAGFDRPCRR